MYKYYATIIAFSSGQILTMLKAPQRNTQEHRLLRLKRRHSKLHFKRGFLSRELQATDVRLAKVALRIDQLEQQLHSKNESKNEIHDGDPSMHVS